MKPWKWIKNHPAEAAAIAAGVAIGGPMLFSALAPAAAGAGAAGAAGAGSLAGASAAVGADAAAIAAAEAAALGGGEAVSGAALGHLAGAGAGAGESALLAGLPMTEYGLGGAGEAMAGGGFSELLSPYAAQVAQAGGYAAPSADPALLGGNTPLSSPYSGWWDKATATLGDKFKDPRTVMRLGMMAAQMGAPRQQGGPAQFSEPPSMRPALASQEDITKKWLAVNDPNTYRRIYG